MEESNQRLQLKRTEEELRNMLSTHLRTPKGGEVHPAGRLTLMYGSEGGRMAFDLRDVHCGCLCILILSGLWPLTVSVLSKREGHQLPSMG